MHNKSPKLNMLKWQSLYGTKGMEKTDFLIGLKPQ